MIQDSSKPDDTGMLVASVPKPDDTGLRVARVPKPAYLSHVFQDYLCGPGFPVVVRVHKPGYLSHVFQDFPSPGYLSQGA